LGEKNTTNKQLLFPTSPPQYNGDFKSVLQERADYFSKTPDALGKVQGQLQAVKAVMVDNLDKVRYAVTTQLYCCSPSRFRSR
jgi:hypothetical protein